jgi:aspartate aminotransferase
MSGDCLPSATLSINERSDQIRGQGLKIYKMGLGQSPFPVPEILVDELKRNAFQKDYLPLKGLLELRRVVAEHHKRIFGIDCTDDDVLIGPGSKELMFILQLVYYGDIVIPTSSLGIICSTSSNYKSSDKVIAYPC